MEYASNSFQLLEKFKRNLASALDITFFGELKLFIGLEVNNDWNGIRNFQKRITKELLSKPGMDICNAKATPMPTNEDLRPEKPYEVRLTSDQYPIYRKIGGNYNSQHASDLTHAFKYVHLLQAFIPLQDDTKFSFKAIEIYFRLVKLRDSL